MSAAGCQSSVIGRRLQNASAAPRSSLLAPRSRRAFTILEMAVVLLIVSILGAAAIPTYFRSLEQQQLETAARRIKQDLELTRQTARTLSKSESLTFTGATTYALSSDVPGLDRKNSSYTVDLSAAPYGVTIISTANLGAPAKVTFDGYGTTTLTTPGTVVIQMGGYKRVVTLDPSTGQATITNN
jgi:prepilin-type N-terminal cleavage/methylation domain-containing protein